MCPECITSAEAKVLMESTVYLTRLLGLLNWEISAISAIRVAAWITYPWYRSENSIVGMFKDSHFDTFIDKLNSCINKFNHRKILIFLHYVSLKYIINQEEKFP